MLYLQRHKCSTKHLSKLVLQSHVILRLKANTSAHDVDQGTALLGKGVDDWCSGGCQRRLEHVAKYAQYRMKALPVLLAVLAPLHAGEELGDKDEVDDEW